MADTSGLIEQLQGEVLFLRGRVEEHEAEIRRRDQAEGELRRLMLADRQELQQLRAQLAIAAAPTEETSQAGDVVTTDQASAPKPPVRTWWQKLQRGLQRTKHTGER
jgi:hypothetical protein